MRGYETDFNRIAIGPRVSSPPGPDASIRSGDVFDDDRLSKRHSHPFGHDSSDHVRGAAGRQRYDHGDGASRKGWRPCDARDGRQRGSARAKPQKSTAWKLQLMAPPIDGGLRGKLPSARTFFGRPSVTHCRDAGRRPRTPLTADGPVAESYSTCRVAGRAVDQVADLGPGAEGSAVSGRIERGSHGRDFID